MIEPFSIVKFFQGFLKWYKILFFVIICGVCIGVYHKVFVQATNNTQINTPNAQAVYTTNIPKVSNFGCVNYKVLGYEKKEK